MIRLRSGVNLVSLAAVFLWGTVSPFISLHVMLEHSSATPTESAQNIVAHVDTHASHTSDHHHPLPEFSRAQGERFVRVATMELQSTVPAESILLDRDPSCPSIFSLNASPSDTSPPSRTRVLLI